MAVRYMSYSHRKQNAKRQATQLKADVAASAAAGGVISVPEIVTWDAPNGLLPTVPGKVHGIVSLDPLTIQCDGCGFLATGVAVMTTCGIIFHRYLHDKDPRRLCTDCQRRAGWEVGG